MQLISKSTTVTINSPCNNQPPPFPCHKSYPSNSLVSHSIRGISDPCNSNDKRNAAKIQQRTKKSDAYAQQTNSNEMVQSMYPQQRQQQQKKEMMQTQVCPGEMSDKRGGRDQQSCFLKATGGKSPRCKFRIKG